MSIQVTSTTDTQTPPPSATSDKAEAIEQVKDDTPSVEAQGEDTEVIDDAGEAAVDSEEATGEEAVEVEERPKKKSGIQRLKEKHAREMAEIRREIQGLRAQAPESQRKVEPKASSDDGRPQTDKFETHEEYVEALADWKVDQKLKAKEVEQRENAIKGEYQRKVETLKAKINTFSKEHDDFQELIESVEEPMSVAVEEFFLMDADNAPALMYELAKNPEEYERINRLPPLAAARELGKIEARLTKETSPRKETKLITKAPPPPSPLSGKPEKAGKKSITDPNLSFAEYERLRKSGVTS